jgi:hypothetical protein
LRAGIARGRSCASILVVPQRKTALVSALHGKQPWPELEFHGKHHGGARRGGERGGRRGAARGGRAIGGLAMEDQMCDLLVCCSCMLYVRGKQEGGKRRKQRKEKKGRKKSKGKRGKFQT